MAHGHLNEEKEYEPATKEAQWNVAAKLLQQMATKRPMAAVRDQNGQLCTGANRIAKALAINDGLP